MSDLIFRQKDGWPTVRYLARTMTLADESSGLLLSAFQRAYTALPAIAGTLYTRRLWNVDLTDAYWQHGNEPAMLDLEFAQSVIRAVSPGMRDSSFTVENYFCTLLQVFAIGGLVTSWVCSPWRKYRRPRDGSHQNIAVSDWSEVRGGKATRRFLGGNVKRC